MWLRAFRVQIYSLIYLHWCVVGCSSGCTALHDTPHIHHISTTRTCIHTHMSHSHYTTHPPHTKGIQELAAAVQKSTFPPNVPFAAFASVRLRGHMINFINDIQHTRDRATPYKLSARARTLIRRVCAVREALGRAPTMRDLHAAMPEVPGWRLAAAVRAEGCVAASWEQPVVSQQSHSMHEDMGGNEREGGGVLVHAGEQASWQEAQHGRLLAADVDRMLTMLPPKDATTLRVCYDVRGEDGSTVWEQQQRGKHKGVGYKWHQKRAAIRRLRGNKHAMDMAREMLASCV